jgi:HEAT repeat protein
MPITWVGGIMVVQVLALAFAALQGFSPAPSQQSSCSGELLSQLKGEKVFWRQFKVATEIVGCRDSSVLRELAGWLNHEDRHIRGNVAFVFAGLGDDRGFATIAAILADRSDRPEGQGLPGIVGDGRYRVEQQIIADRYYAAHLLGDLKDARALPILAPLLKDEEVNWIVPWALGEIGDTRAASPLIEALGSPDPSMRVLAILALRTLGAKEALPYLRDLRGDNEKSSFGELVSVAQTAREAIAMLEATR